MWNVIDLTGVNIIIIYHYSSFEWYKLYDGVGDGDEVYGDHLLRLFK